MAPNFLSGNAFKPLKLRTFVPRAI